MRPCMKKYPPTRRVSQKEPESQNQVQNQPVMARSGRSPGGILRGEGGGLGGATRPLGGPFRGKGGSVF